MTNFIPHTLLALSLIFSQSLMWVAQYEYGMYSGMVLIAGILMWIALRVAK